LIGKFSSAEPKPLTREVHAGDPFDLRIVMEGEGNLDRLSPPPVTNSTHWGVVASIGKANVSVSGNKAEVHYTLIPKVPGMAATPTIPFSYFDPQEKRYVDLTIPSISVLVLPPIGGRLLDAETNATLSETAPEGLGQLATRPKHFVSTLVPLQQRPIFWLWQAVAGIALGGWYGWRKRQDFLVAHPEVVSLALARRALRQLDKRRRQAVAARDVAGYVTAAVASLRVVAAPRLEATAEALVCDEVLLALSPNERQGQVANLVRTFFAAGDELAFQAKTPSAEKIWAWQPELDALLGELRRRLC
jgi:hypothetical protein